MKHKFVLMDIRDDLYSVAHLRLSDRDTIIFFKQIFDYCIDYEEYTHSNKIDIMKKYFNTKEYYDLCNFDEAFEQFQDISISIYNRLKAMAKKMRYASVLDIPYRFRNLNKYCDAILEKVY